MAASKVVSRQSELGLSYENTTAFAADLHAARGIVRRPGFFANAHTGARKLQGGRYDRASRDADRAFGLRRLHPRA